MLEQIEEILQQGFQPEFLKVENFSHEHAGHGGAHQESHFRIHMQSRQLSGLSRVQMQQKVNVALEGLFQQGLHALELHLS